MSILNVNKINPVGGGSTITIAGIASVTNNISVGNSVTATTYYGDGSQLTGISVDTTKIETGDTKVETIDTGSDGHVKITVDGLERFRVSSNAIDAKRQINLESAGSYIKSNQLKFNPSGAAYIDHGVTGQSLNFRMSSSSALDTNALTINSSGYVTNPTRPCFDVAKDNGAVSSTNAIVFNVVNVNIGSHYNTSNGRFTAPITGRYFLYYGGIKDGNNNVVRVKLLKNGTGNYMNNDRELRLDTGGNYVENASMNVIVELTANDYVQVYVTEGTIYGTDPSYTHFGGYLLS